MPVKEYLVIVLLVLSAFLLPFLSVVPSASAANAAIIQTASCNNAAATSISCSFPNTVSVSSEVVLAISVGNVESSFVVSANSNAYVNLGCLVSNTGTAAIYYLSNGAGTYTFSWSGGSTSVLVNLLEVGAVNLWGIQCGTNVGTSTTPDLVKNLAGTAANGPFICALYANNPSSYTAGSGMTALTSSATGDAEYATTGSVAGCPWTLGSSVAWAVAVLAMTTPQVNRNSNTAASATSVALTTTNYVSKNNVVIACAGSKGAQTTPSIGDDQTNSWTLLQSVSNTAQARCWRSLITNPGVLTVTVTGSATDQWGLAVQSQTGITTANEASVQATGSGTTYSTGNLAYSYVANVWCFVSASANIGTQTAGSGYTLQTGLGNAVLLEYKLANAASNSPATCGSSAANTASWVQIGVADVEIVAVTLFANSGPNTAGLSTTNYFNITRTLFGTSDSHIVITNDFPNSAASRRNLFFGADPGSNIVIAATSALSTSTHQWLFSMSGGVASTTTYSVSGSAVSGNPLVMSVFPTFYEQYKNTCTATPTSPSTWDGTYTVLVEGTQLGQLGNVCSLTTAGGGGAVSDTAVWSDNNQIWLFLNTTSSSGLVWVPYPQKTGAIISGSNTFNALYTETTTRLNTSDPPSYLWLLLVPLILIVLVVAKKRL